MSKSWAPFIVFITEPAYFSNIYFTFQMDHDTYAQLENFSKYELKLNSVPTDLHISDEMNRLATCDLTKLRPSFSLESAEVERARQQSKESKEDSVSTTPMSSSSGGYKADWEKIHCSEAKESKEDTGLDTAFGSATLNETKDYGGTSNGNQRNSDASIVLDMQEIALKDLMERTGQERSICHFYLECMEWNVESAFEMYNQAN